MAFFSKNGKLIIMYIAKEYFKFPTKFPKANFPKFTAIVTFNKVFPNYRTTFC